MNAADLASAVGDVIAAEQKRQHLDCMQNVSSAPGGGSDSPVKINAPATSPIESDPDSEWSTAGGSQESNAGTGRQVANAPAQDTFMHASGAREKTASVEGGGALSSGEDEVMVSEEVLALYQQLTEDSKSFALQRRAQTQAAATAEGLEQPDGQGVCAEDEESEKGNEGVLSEDLVEMMIRAQMIAEGRSAVDVRLCLYIVGICAVRSRHVAYTGLVLCCFPPHDLTVVKSCSILRP